MPASTIYAGPGDEHVPHFLMETGDMGILKIPEGD
jgi:hypothetical protein